MESHWLFAFFTVGIAGAIVYTIIARAKRRRAFENRLNVGASLLNEVNGRTGPSESYQNVLFELRPWIPSAIAGLYGPMLRKSGFYSHSASVAYVSLKCLFMAVSFAGVTFTLQLKLVPDWMSGLIIWIIFGAWALPDIWLWRRMKWYSRQIESDLPFWLDLHTTLVEGGMGFDEALVRLCSETEFAGRPIFRELGGMYRRMLLGEPRSQSLKRMGSELQIESLDVIVASLIQSERMGSAIGDTLRIQADMIRNKVWEDAQERAHKLPTQLVFPIAVGVLPSLFLVTIGPSVLKLVQYFDSSGI